MFSNTKFKIFAGQGVPLTTFQGGTALNLYRDFIGDQVLNSSLSTFRIGPDLIFKRNSLATFVNSLCTIEIANIDQPRFNYSPSGEYLGLLIEPPTTNYVPYSTDFFDSTWFKPLTSDTLESGVTVETSIIPPPFQGFTSNATLLTNTSGYGYHVISWGELPVPPNEEVELSYFYTRSVFVKKDTARYLCVSVSPVPSAESVTSIFDFDAPGGPNFVSESTLRTFVIPYKEDWYRIGFTRLTTNSNTNRITLGIANGPDWTNCVFSTQDAAVSSLSSVYIWGAQAEIGLGPTSYIPTNGSEISRAGDDISVNRRAFSQIYNLSAGSFFIQATNPIADYFSYTNYINTLSANYWSPEETITFRQQLLTNNIPRHSFAAFTNNISTQYWVLGSELSGNTHSLVNTSMSGDISTPSLTSGNSFTLAVAQQENDFVFYHNQELIGSITEGTLPQPPLGINQFNLGRFLNEKYLNGHVQKFGYWPTRLNNQELSAL